MGRRRRPARSLRPLGAGLAGSVALHAAAAALTLAALAWRSALPPPGLEPAVQMLWLPQDAPIATAPGAATEGLEPEDALATQVGALPLRDAPVALAAGLPPLPIPEMEVPEPPADPTALFAATAAVFAPPPPLPMQEPEAQIASLAVPTPARMQEAALPLPPPPLPSAPRPSRAAAAPAQQAAFATPAPAPAEPPTIPVLSGAPRFRRPPAPPAYPDRAREAGLEGTALLRLRVAADGTTQEVRLLRSAGHRMLDEAAQEAARRWEIAPALRNGQPIEAWVEVPVRFRLDD